MAATIAPSTFATGPADEVATADVYQSTATTVTNKLKSSLNTSAFLANIEISKSLRIVKDLEPGKLSKLGIKGVKSKLAALEAIKEGDGRARINALLGPGLVNDLKATTVTGLLAGLGVKGDNTKLARSLLGLAGGAKPVDVLLDGNPKLKILHGAVETIRGAKDLKNAKDVAGLMSKVLGNTALAEVLDMESKFVVLQNVLARAVHLGVPELYDKFFTHFDKPSERRAFANSAIDAALRNPNVDLLNLILDTVGSAALLAKFPNAVPTILRNYKYPRGQGSPTLVEADKLAALVARIDPHWLEYSRKGVWVSNLEALTYASIETMALFKLLPAIRTEWLIAKSYSSSTLVGTFRRAYPKAAL